MKLGKQWLYLQGKGSWKYMDPRWWICSPLPGRFKRSQVANLVWFQTGSVSRLLTIAHTRSFLLWKEPSLKAQITPVNIFSRKGSSTQSDITKWTKCQEKEPAEIRDTRNGPIKILVILELSDKHKNNMPCLDKIQDCHFLHEPRNPKLYLDVLKITKLVETSN